MDAEKESYQLKSQLVSAILCGFRFKVFKNLLKVLIIPPKKISEKNQIRYKKRRILS
jgi:hypothetical protein